MEIRGKLKDDILNGNAVLFLGAGVGMAAGLHGAKDLSIYLHDSTRITNIKENVKNDLGKLVSVLDKDPQFTRNWTNQKLIEYFCDDQNYKNLESHIKILQTNWKAIFTTNYDLTIEKASHRLSNNTKRLIPISNPKYQSSIYEDSPKKLKYFKIHGCIDDLEKRPNDSAPLVITQFDFISSIKRNKPFWDELERYAVNSSIIFIGFNAQYTENNHILSNIIDVQKELVRNFEQPYSPFAILPNIDEETRGDLEDIGINLLEGNLNDFVDSIVNEKQTGKSIKKNNSEKKIEINFTQKKISITTSELEEYNRQFSFYHKDFIKEQRDLYDNLSYEKKIDAWKNEPAMPFIYSGNCIDRTQFTDIKNIMYKLLSEILQKNSPRLLTINGKRASGKTIFIHQIAYDIFRKEGNPILFLNKNASVVEVSDEKKKEFLVSGWNNRLFDKFLSLFHNVDTTKKIQNIPIIIADHVSHRQYALDSLIKQLDNHGKPILLIITLNDSEYINNGNDKYQEFERGSRLTQIYRHENFKLNHKLDDNEINYLYNSISRNFQKYVFLKDILISKAKDPKEANRDLLFILYQWFDKNLRRLDEIILDEAKGINNDITLKKLYLSISAFYRFNIKPPINACLNASEITLIDYQKLRESAIFKYFIELFNNNESTDDYAFSRHPEFARKLFEFLCPQKNKQYEIVNSVLENCRNRDIEFVRTFFNYIYDLGHTFTVNEIKSFKESIEKCQYFKEDSILNHQYGAYLLRENIYLEDARYYLDLAINEEPDNPAFIHAIGNLHYHLYKKYLEEDNKAMSLNHYELAKSFFERDRSVRHFPDEHAYVTDIEMTRFKSANIDDTEIDLQVILEAESDALFFEALKVVPIENQNVLGTRCKPGKRFQELPEEKREILLGLIKYGKASGSLLQYYADDLFNNPKPKNWNRLKELVSEYKNTADLRILIPILIISKKAFILSAESRFEILRSHFDDLVRFREERISFYLIAEYAKLLIIDAFVLGKFTFISKAMSEIRNNLFIRSFPRFIKDEYILESYFYLFDESDENHLKLLFAQYSNEFNSDEMAKKFERLAHIGPLNELYTKIEIDPVSRFWIKAIRKEIAISLNKATLSFKIKYAWDGLKATNFII